MADPITEKQINAALMRAAAIAEAIQALGEVPSGELYAHVMGLMDIHSYNACIDTLVRCKLVTRSASHLLTWVGPAKGSR